MDLVLWIAAFVAAAIVFCVLANLASAGRASSAWGLLGPIGVLVAGFRGLHARLDGAPAPRATPDPVAEWFNCAACGQRLAGIPDAAAEMTCTKCRAVVDGYRVPPLRGA